MRSSILQDELGTIVETSVSPGKKYTVPRMMMCSGYGIYSAGMYLSASIFKQKTESTVGSADNR